MDERKWKLGMISERSKCFSKIWCIQRCIYWPGIAGGTLGVHH